MCVTSLVGYIQSLWHAVGVHYLLDVINFPVGISLVASLTAHLSYLEGAFFVAFFRSSQSTRGWDFS